MDADFRQTMERASARLEVLLGEAQRALRGEAIFDVATVRRMRQAIAEMAEPVRLSQELRRSHPELGEAFDRYGAQLRELKLLLPKIRVMLLSRQINLQANQTQITAVSRWVQAFHQTR